MPCAEAWATENAAEGFRPGEAGFAAEVEGESEDLRLLREKFELEFSSLLRGKLGGHPVTPESLRVAAIDVLLKMTDDEAANRARALVVERDAEDPSRLNISGSLFGFRTADDLVSLNDGGGSRPVVGTISQVEGGRVLFDDVEPEG